MNIKRLFISIITILVIISFSECKSTKQTTTQKEEPAVMIESKALPPVIIYKTVKDYSNFVPVIMNDDKTKIVSYPSIKDIQPSSKPTLLYNDYLLDNRGISKNVAFLKYTYEEYAKFSKTPSVDELFVNILNKDPLTEIYDCGKRNEYKDLVKDLNIKIKEAGSDMNKSFKSLK